MGWFNGLQPALLWQHFAAILQIPHGSGNEAKLKEYVIGWATRHSFSCCEDKAGNLVIRVPANVNNSKFINAPTVALQAHLDMVTEKDAALKFDFAVDPIQAWVDGDWVRARGTTLGADNGIGVATALAIAEDPKVQHGPLELLFTVDEEVGLTGATNLATDLLQSRYLLNLDSEEEGIFCIGCAGGAQAKLHVSLAKASLQSDVVVASVELGGLQGGHSGMNIIDNRGNAIKLLARLLSAGGRVAPVQLLSFVGGSKHNAIPREAKAMVACARASWEQARKAIQDEFVIAQREFAGAENSLSVNVSESANVWSEAFSYSESCRFLNLLLAIPHGVATMSRDLPGLVETSSNLAIVKNSNDGIEILLSVRSSVPEAKEALLAEIAAVVALAGASVEVSGRYPAWRPNNNSWLLAHAKQLWQQTTGKSAQATAIHAGLECGVILEKYPNMDAISFGPDICDVHSPSERANISSTGRFYEFLSGLLTSLAQ